MSRLEGDPLLAQLLGPATDYLLERGDPRAAILQALVEAVDPWRDPYRTISLLCAAHGRGEMKFSRSDDRALMMNQWTSPLRCEYELTETIDLWRRSNSDRRRREDQRRADMLRNALAAGLVPPTIPDFPA